MLTCQSCWWPAHKSWIPSCVCTDLRMKSAILQLSVVLQSQLYVFIWVITEQTLIMLMKMHQFWMSSVRNITYNNGKSYITNSTLFIKDTRIAQVFHLFSARVNTIQVLFQTVSLTYHQNLNFLLQKRKSPLNHHVVLNQLQDSCDPTAPLRMRKKSAVTNLWL